MFDLVSEGRAGELFFADECTYSSGNFHINLSTKFQGNKLIIILTRSELSILMLNSH